MKRQALAAAVVLALTACGAQQQHNGPDWRGGLYNVWEPPADVAPKGALILHQGHDCFNGCRYDDSLVPAAEAFVAAGFVVYGFEMPPEPHDAGPIERYYQPVLDLIHTLPDDMPVYMVGLSGGGLTTTLVTALDPRIRRGYSVAGDAPGVGDDWEYLNLPAPALALYAQAGNRLLHIYNFNEGGKMGGFTGSLGYAYVNDYTSDHHMMSTWTVNYIIEDIERGM